MSHSAFLLQAPTDGWRKFDGTPRPRNGPGPRHGRSPGSPVPRVYPMFSGFRYSLIASLVGLFLLVAVPSDAHGGWMGFRNDTGKTLIIQETVAVGSSSRPGKPQKIFANETVRDTPLSDSGQRVFTIYDTAHPDKPLYTGKLHAPAANENVLYVIKLNKGELAIEAVKTAALTSKSPAKR